MIELKSSPMAGGIPVTKLKDINQSEMITVKYIGKKPLINHSIAGGKRISFSRTYISEKTKPIHTVPVSFFEDLVESQPGQYIVLETPQEKALVVGEGVKAKTYEQMSWLELRGIAKKRKLFPRPKDLMSTNKIDMIEILKQSDLMNLKQKPIPKKEKKDESSATPK